MGFKLISTGEGVNIEVAGIPIEVNDKRLVAELFLLDTDGNTVTATEVRKLVGTYHEGRKISEVFVPHQHPLTDGTSIGLVFEE